MSADRMVAISLLWRIERRDGVTIALTDHDRDLTVGGHIYRAAPGMTPSAIVREEGLEADTMEARGALVAGAITARALEEGRWDGARVVTMAVDRSTPEAAPAWLADGTIGEVEARDGAFSAELRGSAAALARPVVETTSPSCRAELGDRRCRVPMAARRAIVRVTAVDGAVLTLGRAEPVANAYGDGLLRWLSGPNAGLENAVATSDGATLTLRTPPLYPPGPGVMAQVVQGCDKRLVTCAARFGNVANFRGEPFLPGMDLLTRYPGA